MLPNVAIGIISQINWGDPLASRVGLLDLAFSELSRKQANTKAMVIAGGLISWRYHKPLYQRLKDDDERYEYCSRLADELASVIPRIDNGKIYLMTSPAPNLDGPIGEVVATLLTDIRRDIRYYPQQCERIPFDGMKDPDRLAILVCSKTLFSSDYQSTPVDNVLKQELKRSSQKRAKFYAVAGLGVYVHKPPDTRPEYIGVPALHRLQTVTTENQVGMVLLDVMDDIVIPTCVSFKDQISRERSYVSIPAGLPPLSRNIYAKLKEGSFPLGQLADLLGEEKEVVLETVQSLTQRQWQKYPQIRLDISSRRVDFEPRWLQHQLRYPGIPSNTVPTTFVVLACLHAGSKELEYDFVLERLVQTIIDNNADALAAVGDLIQGLKHDLEHRGEVVEGTLYSDHEEMAAILLSRVLTQVFEYRLERALARQSSKKRYSKREVCDLLRSCMLPFYYAEGNHDQWVIDLGFRTLAHFALKLHVELHTLVEQILAAHRLPCICKAEFAKILEEKVIATHPLGWRAQTPKALKAGFAHPHKGSTKTKTARLEEVMSETLNDCNVVFVGNFHAAVATVMWSPEQGLRVGFQLSTMLNKTQFEENKTKKVFRNFGVVRMESANGRIHRYSTRFVEGPRTTDEKQHRYLEELKKRFGKY